MLPLSSNRSRHLPPSRTNMHNHLHLTSILREPTRVPLPRLPQAIHKEHPVPGPVLSNQEPLLVPGIFCRDLAQFAGGFAFEVTFGDEGFEELGKVEALGKGDCGLLKRVLVLCFSIG